LAAEGQGIIARSRQAAGHGAAGPLFSSIVNTIDWTNGQVQIRFGRQAADDATFVTARRLLLYEK
jgi:hypothetical protein